jgi:hypothetical protein
MALTTARSSGGKTGRSAAAWRIVENEISPGPTSSPIADRIGVKLDFGTCCHVRHRRVVVQEKNERGALPERVRDFSSPNDAQRILNKPLREPRTVARRRTRHGATPFAKAWIVLENESQILHSRRQARQPYKVF